MPFSSWLQINYTTIKGFTTLYMSQKYEKLPEGKDKKVI